MGNSHLPHDPAGQSPAAKCGHPGTLGGTNYVRCAWKDKLWDRPWTTDSDHVCGSGEARCLGGEPSGTCVLPAVSRSFDGPG